MLTVGSLFSGIGGLELGLERTGGFKTIWQVEINNYAAKVLEKRWTFGQCFRDIKECRSQPVILWILKPKGDFNG
jgi:DNA (cytosine-5)-methyltransferase 1